MAGFNHRIKNKRKISHGRTRNLTEKAEAETRNKTEAAEAFATEGRTRIKSLTILITKKVRMERLQWGFPIATALSLNRPKRK
jgi:hypothetical protein